VAGSAAPDPLSSTWAQDGRHPSVEGSYLAAAVLAAALERIASHTAEPVGLQHADYDAGLGPATAGLLREVAVSKVSDGL
jgi:hypothetical protein